MMGVYTGAATMEVSMESAQTLRIDLPYDQAAPILGIYPKEIRSTSKKPAFNNILIVV